MVARPRSRPSSGCLPSAPPVARCAGGTRFVALGDARLPRRRLLADCGLSRRRQSVRRAPLSGRLPRGRRVSALLPAGIARAPAVRADAVPSGGARLLRLLRGDDRPVGLYRAAVVRASKRRSAASLRWPRWCSSRGRLMRTCSSARSASSGPRLIHRPGVRETPALDRRARAGAGHAEADLRRAAGPDLALPPRFPRGSLGNRVRRGRRGDRVRHARVAMRRSLAVRGSRLAEL